VFFNLKLFN